MSSTENRGSLSPAWSRDDAEPRPLAADSVARKLREARTDAGRDLDDIAHALRIRYDYLLAIEEGRFEDLPGPTYAVGFVRAYADHLKLDTEDIATRFKAEVADFTRRTELVFPTPEPETRVPGSLIFLVSAVLIAGAYGVWYFSSSGPNQVALPPRVDEIPEVPSVEAPAPQPSVSVADLPEAPPGFVDPSDSDPSLAGPPVPDPGVDAEPAPGAQVAAEPPLPAAEAVATATPDPDAGSSSEAPAGAEEGLGEAQGDADGESLAAAEADPEVAEPDAGAPAAEESVAEESVAEESGAEAPADETAAAAEDAVAEDAETVPAAGTASAEPAENDDFEDADAQEAATVVVVRGTETAETEVEAVPQTEAQTETEAETAASETVEQRDGVTIAPLPPQAPDRRPLAQPDPVQTAALGEPEPETPAVYGAVNGESRIVVRAIYDSYVLIRDADDKLILTKVLRRGESYRVPDQQGLTMLTGNAGGLQIEVDGEATPSVGAVGAIVRNINLDPARLKSGNATGP